MSEWTQQEVDQMIQKISVKAATDKDFRQLALTNPNEAIKQVAGKEVPEGYTIKMIENAPGVDQTFVLPDYQDDVLSDNEVDQVDGGGQGEGTHWHKGGARHQKWLPC
jgi:hypothetical protein